MRILITGATGFIGRHLLLALKRTDHTCCAVTRNAGIKIEGADEYVYLDLKQSDELPNLPTDFDAVIHLADGLNELERYRSSHIKAEVVRRAEPTIALAKWAVRKNIKHFIYISSVKAMCGETEQDILTELSKAKPNSAYGLAKCYTERALRREFAEYDSRLIILRNPIVHGPGCTSNIRKLLKLADTPWPLPLKKLESYRSTVSVENFCDAIKTVLDRPEAPGGAYLVADDEPLSTGDIINVFRAELGRKTRLFEAPDWMWSIARSFPGIKPIAKRLTGPLVVSDSNFREKFDWRPLQTTRESLQDMARLYAQQKQAGA